MKSVTQQALESQVERLRQLVERRGRFDRRLGYFSELHEADEAVAGVARTMAGMAEVAGRMQPSAGGYVNDADEDDAVKATSLACTCRIGGSSHEPECAMSKFRRRHEAYQCAVCRAPGGMPCNNIVTRAALDWFHLQPIGEST